jgi:hypothetical protein
MITLCVERTNGVEATAERETAKNTRAARMLSFDYWWGGWGGRGGSTRLGGRTAITGPSRSGATLVKRITTSFYLLSFVICQRAIEAITGMIK